MATTKIELPTWFNTGLKFKGKWINYGDNICEVMSIDLENNTCTIKINTQYSEWTETNWNLQHTLWGFDGLDYTTIN